MVLGPHLVHSGKRDYFAGIDIGISTMCVEPLPQADQEITGDFRALTERDLAGFDCICHLAAISNDPMGDLNPSSPSTPIAMAPIELARRAKRAGVPRYLFSGSCSVYGKGEKLDLDEEARFNPVSAYGISKVETEQTVRDLADGRFSPAFLRNAIA